MAKKKLEVGTINMIRNSIIAKACIPVFWSQWTSGLLVTFWAAEYLT